MRLMQVVFMRVLFFYMSLCDSVGVYTNLQYWTALIKKDATVNADTYWIDGSSSTFNQGLPWSPSEPNENVECIRLRSDGFADRTCTINYQYICKMPTSKQRSLHTERKHCYPSIVCILGAQYVSVQ